MDMSHEREHSVVSMSDLLLRDRSFLPSNEELFSDASNTFNGAFQNIPPTQQSLDCIKNSRRSSINTTTNSESPLVKIQTSVKPKFKRICKRILILLNICTIIGLTVALIVVSNRNNSDDGNNDEKQKGSTTETPQNQHKSTTGKNTNSLTRSTTQSILSLGSSPTITVNTRTSTSPITQGSLSTALTSLDGGKNSTETTQEQGTSSTKITTAESRITSTSTNSITTISTTATTDATIGNWLPWGTYTDCSATCGNGIHYRYRECEESISCKGKYVQVESCFDIACPEYGVWTQWSSWSTCDVTCNGGIQTRKRSCNKTDDSVLNCTGGSLQHQQCSSWNCPDCSITCQEGVLSQTCDMCVCNTTRQGYVMTSLNETVSDAAIFINGSQATSIAYSESVGMFTSNIICDATNIYAEKLGYSSSVCSLNSDTILCKINKNEKPIFYEQPQPKARLEGENVTLCCSAKGIPDIKYYEWMKESEVLDESLYISGETLQISDLSKSDSGNYRCRAVSEAGSVMSEKANVIVKGTVNKFCDNSLGQRQIHLPDDCVQPGSLTAAIEVGYCNRQLCRKNDASESSTCREESQNCCTVSDFDLNTILCSGYNLTILGVKACDCGKCNYEEVRIVGTVLYFGTDEYVKFGMVYLNGIFKTFTSSDGSFKISVDERYGSAAITVISNNYQTTGVIDVSEGTTGTLFINIFIARESCILQIEATEDSIIDIENCGVNPVGTLSFPMLNISANSFIDNSFNTFDGIVDVHITYLNASSISELDIMPGTLYTLNVDGEKVHITSIAAFRFTFIDSLTENALKLGKNINLVSIETHQLSLTVFELQNSNGLWYPISDKLPTKLAEDNSKSWINIGKYLGDKRECFFNIRIYENVKHLSEITNNKYQLFIKTIHIDGHHSFETYGHTFSTSRTCFKTICDGGNGFIEVWISNAERESAEYLLPANPNDNNVVGLSLEQRQLITYSVNTSNSHLNLKFILSSNGPFFEDQNSCLSKTQDSNHFKFHFLTSLEDVFTLRHFNDLSSQNTADMKEIGQRVWYPKRQEGHRVCFVKIKFVLFINKNIKIRVTSYGGTNKNISDEILGIRETKTSTSKAVCLEYKCSGTINEEIVDDDFDYTKVKIQYFSSNVTECVVDSFSHSLVAMFSELNPQNEGKDTFIFHAPTTSSPTLGVYSASTSSYDIYTARSTARKECLSGIPMDLFSYNPDVGTAVTFECD